MTTHSSIAWRIPGQRSLASYSLQGSGVGHNWSDSACTREQGHWGNFSRLLVRVLWRNRIDGIYLFICFTYYNKLVPVIMVRNPDIYRDKRVECVVPIWVHGLEGQLEGVVPILNLVAWDPRRASIQFKSEGRKNLMFQLSGSQAVGILPYWRKDEGLFFRPSADWERPTHNESDLLYTQPTMPISSGNTLTDTRKTVFDPMSEHPMAQSS